MTSWSILFIAKGQEDALAELEDAVPDYFDRVDSITQSTLFGLLVVWAGQSNCPKDTIKALIEDHSDVMIIGVRFLDGTEVSSPFVTGLNGKAEWEIPEYLKLKSDGDGARKREPIQ